MKCGLQNAEEEVEPQYAEIPFGPGPLKSSDGATAKSPLEEPEIYVLSHSLASSFRSHRSRRILPTQPGYYTYISSLNGKSGPNWRLRFILALLLLFFITAAVLVFLLLNYTTIHLLPEPSPASLFSPSTTTTTPLSSTASTSPVSFTKSQPYLTNLTGWRLPEMEND